MVYIVTKKFKSGHVYDVKKSILYTNIKATLLTRLVHTVTKKFKNRHDCDVKILHTLH